QGRSGVDRLGSAPNFPHGGPPPPQLVAVLDVVEDQGEVVGQLDSDRRPDGVGVAAAEGLAGEERQVGPHPFPRTRPRPAQPEMVLHHLGEQRGLGGPDDLGKAGELPVEGAIHGLQPGGTAGKGFARVARRAGEPSAGGPGPHPSSISRSSVRASRDPAPEQNMATRSCQPKPSSRRRAGSSPSAAAASTAWANPTRRAPMASALAASRPYLMPPLEMLGVAGAAAFACRPPSAVAIPHPANAGP